MVVVIVVAGFVLGIVAALLGLERARRDPADDGRETLPSAALDPATLEPRRDELVETLRDLIRIPSVNPPPADARTASDGPRDWIAGALADAGSRPEILELGPGPRLGRRPAPRRRDRRRAPAPPESHLDVVPAPPERWTHDPFGGDIADGYVWGRGAVDMKHLVAMELAVMRMLAAEARAAGRDPAADPIPGLTRDVILACTADEEAGGLNGIGWIIAERPELLRAAGAINESGAVATTVAGRRFYPIGVAEKGYAVVPAHRPRDVGPRLDAARRQRRGPGRDRGHPPGRPRARPARRR